MSLSIISSIGLENDRKLNEEISKHNFRINIWIFFRWFILFFMLCRAFSEFRVRMPIKGMGSSLFLLIFSKRQILNFLDHSD